MNKGFYLQTSRVEEHHWWFRHRRRLVSDVLDSATKGGGLQRALDLGCGSGGNLRLLERYCAEVVGLDRSDYALELAREKSAGARLVRGDANRLTDQFPEGGFDLVTVFNVLYHRWIENDAAVLAQIGRVLRPEGLLVLTEPAFELLYRRHDVVDHGARRYRLGPLRRKVREAGLAVRRCTYFNAPGLAPALVQAIAERLRGRLRRPTQEDEEATELALPGAVLNRTIYAVLSLERAWIRHVGLVPAGVTLMIVAARPAA